MYIVHWDGGMDLAGLIILGEPVPGRAVVPDVHGNLPEDLLSGHIRGELIVAGSPPLVRGIATADTNLDVVLEVLTEGVRDTVSPAVPFDSLAPGENEGLLVVVEGILLRANGIVVCVGLYVSDKVGQLKGRIHDILGETAHVVGSIRSIVVDVLKNAPIHGVAVIDGTERVFLVNLMWSHGRTGGRGVNRRLLSGDFLSPKFL